MISKNVSKSLNAFPTNLLECKELKNIKLTKNKIEFIPDLNCLRSL